jgi:outer membrane lipoprotein SlyB
MCAHPGRFAFSLALLFVVFAAPVVAQNSDAYNQCVAWAQQQSGYYGGAPNPSQNAPLRGAAAGAASGAFFGGVTGGNAGTGAAIGAAFGAVAGGARRREAQRAQQNAQNNFYNALNRCLSHAPQ